MTLTTDGRTHRASAQRESRRDHILDVALAVFARKGYHQTRVSDIIEAAGIARGTFYLYFESKNAIFLELLDRLLASLRGAVVGVDVGGDAPPVEDQLLETVRAILYTVANNRRLATILVREAVGLDAEVDAKLREFYGSLFRYVKESLERGCELGIVRSTDTDVTAMCVLGSVKHVVEHTMLMDAELDVERMARAILDFDLRGLLAGA